MIRFEHIQCPLHRYTFSVKPIRSWVESNCEGRVLNSYTCLPERRGKVITFGYHSVVMGRGRSFHIEQVALFSHGGAIHDTIVSVERYCPQIEQL
jgi:hypothetical protein